MGISIEVEGADKLEVALGLAAAVAVFARAGTTTAEVHAACCNRDDPSPY